MIRQDIERVDLPVTGQARRARAAGIGKSSTRRCSKRRSVSVATTHGGTPGVPSPDTGCYAGWSSAVTVAWAYRATRCAGATARSIGTTTATIMIPSGPVANIAVARSATFVPTSSTLSSSSRSATPCCARSCSWPVSTPCRRAASPSPTSCCRRNWPNSNVKARPPMPRNGASSIFIRQHLSTATSCCAGPRRSRIANKTWNNSATP